MTEVFLVGVGMTPFDRHDGIGAETLGRRAVVAAMRDAGVGREEVRGVYAAHMYQGEVLGERVLRGLGFPPHVPVINLENACAGGSSAVRQAFLDIEAGRLDLALVLGVETMGGGQIAFSSPDMDLALGITAPAQYALCAQRHMHEFGTPAEAFARIAVKSRAHGARNPNARLRQEVTLDEVLASRPIAEPLTLLQCCRNGSGAAAAVLGTRAHADRRGGPPIRFRGTGLAGVVHDRTPRDLTSFGGTRPAAAAAYETAGIGPEDVDVVELHDAFTAGELLHYEGLGLCAKGEGARLAIDGETALGGRVPVNLSGGLLSKSHPTGATGVAQFAEIFWQLRGAAAGRQVEGARIGLAHSQGGTGLDTGATCVALLSRE